MLEVIIRRKWCMAGRCTSKKRISHNMCAISQNLPQKSQFCEARRRKGGLRGGESGSQVGKGKKSKAKGGGNGSGVMWRKAQSRGRTARRESGKLVLRVATLRSFGESTEEQAGLSTGILMVNLGRCREDAYSCGKCGAERRNLKASSALFTL